jgi:hypothetical protein
MSIGGYLSGSVKRTAQAVYGETEHLAKVYGEERLAFLTLTYKKPLRLLAKAQIRWANLVARHLRRKFERIIATWERHENGGIHWHAIVVCPADIKTGFRWDDFQRLQADVRERKRRGWKAWEVGANPALKDLWDWCREHFRGSWGRWELLPLKRSAQAAARYAAWYITKQERARVPSDKGARRVRFINFGSTVVLSTGEIVRLSGRCHGVNFGFVGDKSKLYRAKAKTWAAAKGLTEDQVYSRTEKRVENGEETYVRVTGVLGARWAYHHRVQIDRVDCRALLQQRGYLGALRIAEKVSIGHGTSAATGASVTPTATRTFGTGTSPTSITIGAPSRFSAPSLLTRTGRSSGTWWTCWGR